MNVTKYPGKTVSLLHQQKEYDFSMMNQNRKKKVAAYCRVSTDSEEQMTSYINQKKTYREMIRKNRDWSFAGIYADEGISGTRADRRPQFQKMIEDCRKGKIDYIVTKSVSRFARNTVECLEYVRMLKEQNIGIYFEEQNIDTLKNDSELYLIIYAGFAQAESESLSKNITWSYRKKFEEGEPIFVYRKTLGYQKGEDGNPEVVPAEAEIIRRIFRMYLSGSTTGFISRTLQKEKITVPGKEFNFSIGMISHILQNEKYCGDCILQKTVTLDCISKKRKHNEGEAPMWYVKNSHPAIISHELFNQVQEEIARRKIPKESEGCGKTLKMHSRYALRGIMQCGECGSWYKRTTWNIHGRKKAVWRCSDRLDRGADGCPNSPSLDEKALHQTILEAIQTYREEDEMACCALLHTEISEFIGLTGGKEEVYDLQHRIDDMNQQMLAVARKQAQDGAEAEDCEKECKWIAWETEHLKKRLETLQAQSKEISPVFEEYKDEAVRQMIDRIKVFHDKSLVIIFRDGHEVKKQM